MRTLIKNISKIISWNNEENKVVINQLDRINDLL